MQIRKHHIRPLRCTRSPLTLVSRNKFYASTKRINGQITPVFTLLAACADSIMDKSCKRRGINQRCLPTSLFGSIQRRAICTHKSGNPRSSHISAQFHFQTAQHCIVVEGATLYNNILPKLICVSRTNYLVNGVFYNTNG